MYGTQTAFIADELGMSFENDVKMYGTQTFLISGASNDSLRMM